jgi:hypothetical protein
MAHTPGPWQMTCGYVREVDGCHDLSVFITKGRFIAEVAYNDPEQEANARLVVAVTDLLAACENLLNWSDRRYHGMSVLAWQCVLCHGLSPDSTGPEAIVHVEGCPVPQAEAAIAKAGVDVEAAS